MNREIDFDKMQGLAPAIVQDAASNEVLMLGFMNREACERHALHRLRDIFQPHSQPALDQRGDFRQSPESYCGYHRLRSRHLAAAGRSRRRGIGLSRGHAVLLYTAVIFA